MTTSKLGACGFAWKLISQLSRVLPIFSVVLVTCHSALAFQKTPNPAQSVQRQMLQQTIVSNRLHRVQLSRAKRELKSGNTAGAITLLQSILNLDGDSATLGGEAGMTLISIRTEALQLLGSLPPEALQTYKRVYASVAQRMLDEARKSVDPADFAKVLRHYFYTDSAIEAADWLASRLLDRGDYPMATSTWGRLLSDRHHRRHIRREIAFKAALAYQLSGNSQKAESILDEFGLATIDAAGRPTRAATILAELADRSSRSFQGNDWTQPQGNAGRNASSAGGVPFMLPKWSISLAGRGRQFEIAATWEKGNARSAELLNAVANYPIIVGDQVIVRDFAGLRSFDVTSGRPIWKYPNQVDLPELLKQFGIAKRREPTILSAFVGNATSGMLASDGRFVFSVEFLKPQTEDAKSTTTKSKQKRGGKFQVRTRSQQYQDLKLHNQLVAVPILSVNGAQEVIAKPRWKIGGPANDLAGHYFLGAPLYSNGMLYAITEFKTQIHLCAINPATGRPAWIQSIAEPPRSILHGDQRTRLLATCTPSAADGVIVCPTGCGIVVAVDALTGNLRWVYDYRDYSDRRTRSLVIRAQNQSLRPRGHVGFASVPVIDRNYAVLLPRHSQRLHCVDLKTGEKLWAKTYLDSEYVGAIVDATILLAGNTRVRGISLETGEPIWSKYTGAPSGRGIRVDRKYLLPLGSNNVACIEVETGARTNVELPGKTIDRWSHAVSGKNPEFDLIQPANKLPAEQLQTLYMQPGNLVANEDVIVSVGPQFVTAFPSASALLERIEESKDARKKLQLLASELHLTTGDLNAAEEQLANVKLVDLSQRQQDDVRSLTLELKYAQLKSVTDSEQALLPVIERLSKTREEKGRFLIRKSEWQLQNADFDGLLESSSEFRGLDLRTEMVSADNPQHAIAASSWVPDMIGRIQSRFGSNAIEQIHVHIDTEQTAALQSNTIADLKSFLSVYSEWPQANAIRVALARRYIEKRLFQQAELLLLRNRRQSNLQTAGIATAELTQMWDTLGLHSEAASLLEELKTRFAQTMVAPEKTGQQFVASFNQHSRTAKVLQNRRAPDWPISHVAITDHRWLENNPYLLDSFGRYRRRFLTPRNYGFHLLDKGSTRESKIAVIRRETGSIVGEICVPARHSYPSWSKYWMVGHMIPMGSPATMHGLSLLESDDQSPIWQKEFEQVKFNKEFMRVGPAGPTYFTFQTRQHLIAVNPANGQLLWRRSDVEPGCGLVSDQMNGLFGDEQILVLFAKDRQNYTAYHTRTGKVIRHGRLNVDPQYVRQVFGRKLFYVTQSTIDRRMRIWDPLNDRFEFDEPMSIRLLKTVTPDGDLAVIAGKNQLRILDVATGESKLRLTLTDEQIKSLSYMRIFSDKDRYYLNLQRPLPFRRRQSYSYYTTDAFVMATHVQGELYAVDRQSGAILWNQVFPQRTFVDLTQYRLPFLITLSRIRKSNTGGAKQSLLVDVIDAKTGQRIASKDNIIPDRIVTIQYDRDAGKLELQGLKSRIVLDFSRRIQRLNDDSTPTL